MTKEGERGARIEHRKSEPLGKTEVVSKNCRFCRNTAHPSWWKIGLPKHDILTTSRYKGVPLFPVHQALGVSGKLFTVEW